MRCPHGISYGFHVMPDPETPRTAFYALVTRFKQSAFDLTHSIVVLTRGQCPNW